ncbi:protein GVQW3-like [Oratosquilla oratoria]|uniref:protein GVQW3-like n=1 Tax=Oratosquilla oratoria TaxID=337810 RepID=UPI003F76F3C2
MVAAPTINFSQSEARVVMKFHFLQGKRAAEIHSEMKDVLKDDYPMWVSRFRTGHFEVTDEPRPGRPTSTTTDEKADAMHVMIHEDRRISAKVIAEILRISREKVGHFIDNILDMRKLSTKWVSKWVTKCYQEVA